MPNPLPPPTVGRDCCAPDCSSAYFQTTPGPAGPPGASCVPCGDGLNSFTQLTDGFLMPGSCGEVTIEVVNSDWAVPGQFIYVEFAGTFQVVSTPDSEHIVIRNLQNCGASSTYWDNAPENTPIPSGSRVSPAGQQGPEGNLPSDLFDLSSPTMQKGDILVDDGANSPGAHLVRHPVGTDGETLHACSSTSDGLKWEKVNLSDPAQISGVLPIANGGTAGATKTTAFNNLSPTTTRGDLIFRGVTNNERRGIGTAGSVLTSDGMEPQWQGLPLATNGEADGGGTDFNLPNSYAPVIFGTDQVDIMLAENGTYLLLAVLTFHANGGQDVYFKFRDPGLGVDVPGSEVIVDRGDSVDHCQVVMMSILTGVIAPTTIQVWGYNSGSSTGAVYATLSKSIFVKLSA